MGISIFTTNLQVATADQMRSSTRVRKPDSAKKAALGELAAARQKKTAKHRCAKVHTLIKDIASDYQSLNMEGHVSDFESIRHKNRELRTLRHNDL